jgi:TM2 domain-containing membrane protein YozV
MLYCTYHPKNPGVVQCNQCARQLCSACDHRIRGFPFCQDCIVAGVELLRQSQSSGTTTTYRNSSPFIATLLSFVPGLGAAYNGQTAKAIVHFAIFASFFQMAVLTQGVHFFILGVFGTWVFAAVDACRTAQLIRAGLTPDTEEDVIARRLYGNPFAWGITLVVIGTLFLLHTLLGLQLPVRKLLPVALVALGAYMLFDYMRRSRSSSRIIRFDSRRPPPSVVISTALESPRFKSGETTQFGRKEIESIPFKRSS